MSGLYDDHIKKMREINFLFPDENETDFRSDLHYTKLWADVFWRRKQRHETRLDPEISHLKSLTPQRVLEIGSAYGRVTKKIVDVLDLDAKIEGIEVCNHFEPYFNEYKKIHSELNKVKFYYDNFFKTNLLEKDAYDLILLPMNTFSGFPIQALETLFDKIKSYLKDEGIFLFSTYKISDVFSQGFKDDLMKDNYNSGVLADPKSDMIITEFFSPEILTKDYGVRSIEYISHNRIDRTYKLLERGVFFSQREFIRSQFLEEFFIAKGFEITIKDDSSHSVVYGLRKSTQD